MIVGSQVIMGIALYYSVLIGAVIGSLYYLPNGIKLLQEPKNAQDPEDHPHLRTIALWKTAIGIFGSLLWGTVLIVSIYNQLSSSGK